MDKGRIRSQCGRTDIRLRRHTIVEGKIFFAITRICPGDSGNRLRFRRTGIRDNGRIAQADRLARRRKTIPGHTLHIDNGQGRDTVRRKRGHHDTYGTRIRRHGGQLSVRKRAKRRRFPRQRHKNIRRHYDNGPGHFAPKQGRTGVLPPLIVGRDRP